MNIVDLSHVVSPDIPVYPGTEPPSFTTCCTIEESGFLERKVTMFSHVGTHMDAPAHMIRGAKTLDQFPVEQFLGNACVIPVDTGKKRTIDLAHMTPYEALIADSEFVLLYTGWGRFWGADRYYSGYPVLTARAASWLCSFQLKGIGADVISVDESGAEVFPIHHIFLEKECLIIENLARLDTLETNRFLFSCFPLKLKDADGSPVRAVAICNSMGEGEKGENDR